MNVGLNNLYHTIQPLCWRQMPVCLWVASPPIHHVCENSTCANGVGWGIRLSAGSEASFFYLPAVHVFNPTEQPRYALVSVTPSSVRLDLSSHDAMGKRDGVSALVGCEWQRYMFDQDTWGQVNWWAWLCILLMDTIEDILRNASGVCKWESMLLPIFFKIPSFVLAKKSYYTNFVNDERNFNIVLCNAWERYSQTLQKS